MDQKKVSLSYRGNDRNLWLEDTDQRTRHLPLAKIVSSKCYANLRQLCTSDWRIRQMYRPRVTCISAIGHKTSQSHQPWCLIFSIYIPTKIPLADSRHLGKGPNEYIGTPRCASWRFVWQSDPSAWIGWRICKGWNNRKSSQLLDNAGFSLLGPGTGLCSQVPVMLI